MRSFILSFALLFSLSGLAGFFDSIKTGGAAIAGAVSAYNQQDEGSGGGLSNAVNAALNAKTSDKKGFAGFAETALNITTGSIQAYRGYWGQSGCCPCGKR